MGDPGYAAARYDEMPSLWDGFANLVRAGLGITSFGCNVMNLPPDYETKSHDEAESGQEELYVAIVGSGAVVLDDGTRLPLDADSAVRVSAGTGRTVASGPEGLRVLCVGGSPGKAFELLEWSSGGDL
jgi:uncharacterized cupin superfamily protein